jgi:hypothetical protein
MAESARKSKAAKDSPRYAKLCVVVYAETDFFNRACAESAPETVPVLGASQQLVRTFKRKIPIHEFR